MFTNQGRQLCSVTQHWLLLKVTSIAPFLKSWGTNEGMASIPVMLGIYFWRILGK